jgi:hypothetical protein
MDNLGESGGGGSDTEEHIGETVCICGKVRVDGRHQREN